nr:unnamed protein product [Callosobruchus chinensis]
MTSALASLTATYTDSEGEEEPSEEQPESGEPAEPGKTPPVGSSPEKSNESSRPASPALAHIKVTTKVANLVSYLDDTVVSDEGETEDVPHEVIMMTDEKKLDDQDSMDEDGVMLPPEAPGHCSAELQDKITKLYEKMQTQQLDMNALIQKRKDFRNPSIYEKLIQFCDLNELGTNYPPAIYDPLKWDKESYYEELAKVQKQEMDKREKEKKTKIEVMSGTKKSEEDKKRKSKWDQPSGGGGALPSVKPAGVVQPALTSSATGTKGTVISAFGSLPKKPRP